MVYWAILFYQDYRNHAKKATANPLLFLEIRDYCPRLFSFPNHSYLSQLDVTYKTPDLMSHFLP
ncbi:hypothetical protein, partial [Streptococcus pneumoniae]|uniref:hypothetical protein n=1 Tax=Streptococcus pneumoniae TaxID=1313 RepID=UPI001CD8EFED